MIATLTADVAKVPLDVGVSSEAPGRTLAVGVAAVVVGAEAGVGVVFGRASVLVWRLCGPVLAGDAGARPGHLAAVRGAVVGQVWAAVVSRQRRLRRGGSQRQNGESIREADSQQKNILGEGSASSSWVAASSLGHVEEGRGGTESVAACRRRLIWGGWVCAKQEATRGAWWNVGMSELEEENVAGWLRAAGDAVCGCGVGVGERQG